MGARRNEKRQSIQHLAPACVICALALAGCSSDDTPDDRMEMPKPGSVNAGAGPSSSTAGNGGTNDSSGTNNMGVAGNDTVVAGNGSADGDQPKPGMEAEPGPGVDEGIAGTGIGPDGRITAGCRGLALEGMKFSPGGDVLPNKCAPFDTSTNNPYAIRCIDAMPEFKTPYLGDDYCILPPPPELGFQLGVHPGGNIDYWAKMWAGDHSFYSDPAALEGYELAAGDETVQNYHGMYEVPAGERFFYRRQFRGRYGSHHGVVNFTRTQVTAESWQTGGDLEFGGGEVMMVQNAHTDYPPGSLAIPPEEVGLGSRVSTMGATFNLHHFNSTESPILRENWINVWYIPADQVTKTARGVVSMTNVDYPPNMVLDNGGMFRASAETQLLNLWGHHHAWTTRFHAWIERAAGGDDELIYDSYDWYDMPTFAYNSLVENPEPGIEGQDGAHSGPITLQAGDVIRFNCHVDTTASHAEALDREVPSTPLRYGNQAYDAEMCILLGQQTSSGSGSR